MKGRHRDLAFPRSVRILHRSDYLRIQRSGSKAVGRFLILLTMDNNLAASRFGITVSRATGNAVARNRIKRRLREVVRHRRNRISPGKDIVVIARPEASRASFQQMENDFEDLSRRSGLYRRPPGD